MKKTIASVALALSTANAFAFIGPHPTNPNTMPRPLPPRPIERTICLNQLNVAQQDGSITVRACDASRENSGREAELMANGCAEGQVAMKTSNTNVKIPSCIPFIQL